MSQPSPSHIRATAVHVATLRRLALSVLFTIATTSYQTTCTVSERTFNKRQHANARYRVESLTLYALRHYVFTGVCLSTGVGVPGQVHPQEQAPPPEQAPPRAGTPWSRHRPRAGIPQDQTPPEQAPPLGEGIPPLPGRRHPPVDRHTPVNILPCPKLRLRPVIKTPITNAFD